MQRVIVASLLIRRWTMGSTLEVGPGHKPSMVHGSTTIASEEQLIDHAADGLM